MDIGTSFQTAMDRFIGFLPNLVGFLVLLLIGYIVAKLVAAAVHKVLEKVGVDRRLHESDANRYVEPVLAGASPARGVSRAVFWLIFVFFVFAAIGVLKIAALTTFMNQVLAYLPNIIAAILIFVVAAILASAVAAAVNRTMGDTPTGKVAQAVLPALIMVIAMFMILQQLRIAEQIVQIAFAATIGAIALGLALAFGLGGRPVAQRMLEDSYRKGQEHKDQIRSDMETGRERARMQTSGDPAYSGTHTGETTYGQGSTAYGAPGPAPGEPGTTYGGSGTPHGEGGTTYGEPGTQR